MKLARPTRKTPPESIIPLIDVVFFLLVFFMLIGRLDATAPFDVTPATALTGSDMPGGGVTVSISAVGALAIGGDAMDRDALLRQIAEQLQDAPDTLIRLNAHRDAILSEVLPLAAALEELGARDVVLVVTPGSP